LCKYNFALKYVGRKVKANQERLKQNEIHQLLVYADICWAKHTHTHIAKEMQSLVRRPVLKCTLRKLDARSCLMNRMQSKIKTCNTYLDSVAKFKYLGVILKNQKVHHKEIKGRLNSGNAFGPEPLPSCLLSKNIKIGIYITNCIYCII
jgi:hypothetical protein